jgi:signal transduction histidine kinase
MFHLYQKLSVLLRNRYIYLLAFAIDLILIRFLLYYFEIPSVLTSSTFFDATHYAHSVLFPSPGDLILNLLVLLGIASVFNFKFRPLYISRKIHPALSLADGYLMLLIAFILLLPCLSIFRSLVFDANFSLNLSDISLITTYSFIGLSAIFIMLLSYVMISIRLFEYAYRSAKQRFSVFLIQWILASVTTVILNGLFEGTDYIFVFFIAIYIISLYFFKKYQRRIISFYSTIFYLFLFSVFTTYALQTLINDKEKEERKMIAMQLTQTYNPLVEYNFSIGFVEIEKDLTLQGLLLLAYEDPAYEDSAIAYLDEEYLQHIFPGYERYSTICYPEKVLDIQPDNYLTDCNEYFEGLIMDYGDSSLCKKLFRYNLNESNSYISHISVPVTIADEVIPFDIYSELFIPFIPDEGLGYPELLLESTFAHFPVSGNYSYARYSNGSLVYKYGYYVYRTELSPEMAMDHPGFQNADNYSHYIIPVDDNQYFILSKKNLSLLDAIAPFSYLLLLFAVFTLVYLLLIIFPFESYSLDINFRSRLQISVIVIIVIIFFIVGYVSVTYIQNLYDNKNNTILKEKTHSVLIELEHKLADESNLSADMQPYLSGLLNKFSQVFFSDINLYDLSGQLLASSRPRIFEKGLISTRMNTEAFKSLVKDRKLLFIHEEQISSYKYLSAYVPFRNSENVIVAYLNLPYFAKTSELRTEISSFLTTFLNIYIFFIALSIFLTLLISRYTTRPLQLIKDNMRNLSLGRSNQKINWESNDEIGKLISEYNRMIDELARSAELLAKSERESAWREMAKQVAHEIKNPLTPMKLSVQYLQKAWDEKSVDFDKRLNRFTRTIVEQIDTLSMIASEFSDFAKMPQARSRRNNLIDIIKNAMDLFKDTGNIQLNIHYDPDLDHIVMVDQKQLLRVFNNLIQNSIEAIGNDKEGKIDIRVEADYDEFLVHIIDSGPGIPVDQAEKIFSPSFTTKTSGMGLGLAMARSIIINSGGEITYESENGNGAIFLIRLPRVKS